MKKTSVSVVFDRKRKVKDDGIGTVDVVVYLNRKQRKYISMGTCKRSEWEALAQTKHVLNCVARCEKVLSALAVLKLEVNTANFNTYYYKDEETAKPVAAAPKNLFNGNDLDGDFIAYLEKEIAGEQVSEGTRKHKYCMLRAVKEFGQIKTFADLTAAKIMGFDDWLHDGKRTAPTIYNYHKNLKKITRRLRMAEMIPFDPYQKVSVKRGKCKERRPLSEAELQSLMAIHLEGKMAKSRDLFIFCSYTGLAYCDTMAFDFEHHAVKVGNLYYIDGSRIKTGCTFFTPILAPAMRVLKKYGYKLPKISDQKVNDYLHLIQALMGLNKSLTFHVARHSFATMVLAHDVPIENLARMLGHSNIRTTQIYAKVLKSTIERHSEVLNEKLLMPKDFNKLSAKDFSQSKTR